MKLSEFFSNLQITEKPVRQPEKSQKFQKNVKPDVYHLRIHEFKFEQINLSFLKINWINIEGIIYKPKSNSEVLYFLYDFLDNSESIKKHTILKIRDGKFKTAGFVHPGLHIRPDIAGNIHANSRTLSHRIHRFYSRWAAFSDQSSPIMILALSISSGPHFFLPM
jgi:hypothetical protein